MSFALLLLLGVSIALGPSSAAMAGLNVCGFWCPCEDDEQHGEPAEFVAQAYADRDGGHEMTPGNTVPCPDDCPDCDCCPGLMGGLLSVVVSSVPATTYSTQVPELSDAPAYGEVSGIFRPPRSLT